MQDKPILVYIRQNGKINPNGVIRVLSVARRDSDRGDDPNRGAALYHDDLLPYGDEFYKATVEDNLIVVIRIGDGSRVKTIEFGKLIDLSSIELREVREGGWLVLTGDIPEADRRLALDRHKLILAVEKGKKDYNIDKSPDFRVNPALEGRVFTFLSASEWHESRVIYTPERQIIPVEVLYPLSGGRQPLVMPGDD